MLALKELAQGKLLGDFVIPVVEPVKSTSTFDSTIRAFTDTGQPIAIILNPAVGEWIDRSGIRLLKDSVPDSVIPSIIMDDNAERVVRKLCRKKIEKSDMLSILTNRDHLGVYHRLFDESHPKYTLLSNERQMRRDVKYNKVMFEDKFKKRDKNADYLDYEDEFFSDDHLYFKEEGFAGFGDYSIIGDEYNTSGFAPRAVAIHIVYFAKNKTLRIRHFVSDTNEDISDVAGKFYEAVTKLREWCSSGQQDQKTQALSTLLVHAEKGYYPGLPTIKKLSIMHHLELVGRHIGNFAG